MSTQREMTAADALDAEALELLRSTYDELDSYGRARVPMLSALDAIDFLNRMDLLKTAIDGLSDFMLRGKQ